MIEATRAVLLPLWPLLAASWAAGMAFGLLGWREQPAGFWGRLGLILTMLVVIGAAGLAFSGRVPGRPGLWLEIGLASLVSYLAGCVLGGLGRGLWRKVARRPDVSAPLA